MLLLFKPLLLLMCNDVVVVICVAVDCDVVYDNMVVLVNDVDAAAFEVVFAFVADGDVVCVVV